MIPEETKPPSVQGYLQAYLAMGKMCLAMLVILYFADYQY